MKEWIEEHIDLYPHYQKENILWKKYVMTVVGTRPEIIKLSAVINRLENQKL